MSKLIVDAYASLTKDAETKWLLDANQDRWFSRGETLQVVAQVGQWLTERDVPIGARVLIGGGNTFSFITAYFGVILSGRVALPVHADATPREWLRLLDESHAVAAILTADVDHHKEIVAATEERDVPLAELQTDGSIDTRDGSVDMTIAEQGQAIAETHPAILLFTSGTTGKPKGVVLNHRQMYANIQNVISSHRLTSEDISYCFLPLFHINAQVVALWSTLLSGGKIILQKRFSASRFWPTVTSQKVTWVSAVPAVIAILLQTEKPADKSRLRFVRSASAPLPHQRLLQFEDKFGVPVIESYGMTEAASQICVNPLPPAKHKPGSVGIPYGVELRVVNDDFIAQPANQIGEISIRGDSVITAYDEGAGADAFVDGWFLTGDIGYQDSDGFVYLVSRKKELINRAGEKISPREIEEVLLTHPAVHQAAVIGVPDEILGERIAAYVTVHDGVNAAHIVDELSTLCAEQLSKFKRPAEISVVSELPAGPTGKIQRVRLREHVIQTRQN